MTTAAQIIEIQVADLDREGAYFRSIIEKREKDGLDATRARKRFEDALGRMGELIGSLPK